MKNLTSSTAVTLTFVSILTAWASGKSTGSATRGTTESNTTSNKVIRPIEENFNKLMVNVGDDVPLKCYINEHEPVSSPQYEWYKQNPTGIGKKRMTQFGGRYELSSQGQVKIRSVTQQDSGLYICKLAVSKDSYSIQLTVGNDTFKNNLLKPAGGRKGNSEEPYSEPEIIRDYLPKEKIYHTLKGSLILLLKCESKGNPEPTITWYRNGKIVSSSRGRLSQLKLTSLSKEDDGIYKCESVNIFGISVYELIIKVNDASQGAAEILELSPKNLTVPAGSSVNISCVAKFETQPWFVWVKKVRNNKTGNGTGFFHADTAAYYEVLQSSSVKGRGDRIYSTDLVLTNVTKNHTGVYYCAVAGLQGYNLSETTVIVESDPSHLQFNNPKTIAAQWAILWTLSFVILMVLIVLCFVRIYGCHNHQIKTECKVNHPRKTQLPERSPQTMSTHCTTYLQGQESFVPLMVGSCSLSSQDHLRGYESSEVSHCQPYVNSFHYPSDDSSATSSNSTLLADLEAARSYCDNSGCPKYPFKPCSRKHSYGHCSASRNRIRRTRRSQRPHSTHIHHHPPKVISNSPVSCSYGYITNSSNSHYGEYNLSSTDCESSSIYYEPKRKKNSHSRHVGYDYDYFHKNNSEQL